MQRIILHDDGTISFRYSQFWWFDITQGFQKKKQTWFFICVLKKKNIIELKKKLLLSLFLRIGIISFKTFSSFVVCLFCFCLCLCSGLKTKKKSNWKAMGRTQSLSFFSLSHFFFSFFFFMFWKVVAFFLLCFLLCGLILFARWGEFF